jgi:hypothetical protein
MVPRVGIEPTLLSERPEPSGGLGSTQGGIARW